MRLAPLSRRSCFTAAVLAALPLAGASAADGPQTLALLKEARAQLDACDSLIADGSWDAVRTVVKTAPLVNAKNLITTYIQASGEAAEDLVVPRQDLVQSLQLLDMNVYNNVFVGEQNGQGKKGAGVPASSASHRIHMGLQPMLTCSLGLIIAPCLEPRRAAPSLSHAQRPKRVLPIAAHTTASPILPGVKIDRATPMGYLRDSKDALNEIIAFK